MARTIESPGVQISEIDLSLRPAIPTGTNVLVAGFSDQGPTDEVIQVTTLSEFASIYGTPKTPAERYFYHSVAPLFSTQANVYTYKLPYGDGNGTGFGSSFGALVYPASAVNVQWNGAVGNSPGYGTGLATYNAAPSGVMYLFGKPTHIELTQDQYNAILQQNNGFSWKNTPKVNFTNLDDLGNAGLIILNQSQTTIDSQFQGYYMGIADNSNLNPITNFDCLISAESLTLSAFSTKAYTTIPTTRLNFNLSSVSDNHNVTATTNLGTSVSEVLENAPTFNIDTVAWNDTAIFGLFKLRQSVFAPDTIKLDYVFSEKYVGSFDNWRQINSQNGGQPISFFIESKDVDSPNIQILVNPFISHRDTSTWLNTLGIPTNSVRFITQGYRQPFTLLKTLSTEFGITQPSAAPTQIGLLSPSISGAYTVMGAADSLFALGSYQAPGIKLNSKDLGSIPQKLDRMFDIAENSDIYNFDISIDAGVSTIFAVSEYLNNTSAYTTSPIKYFDDTIYVTAITGLEVQNPDQISGEAGTFRSNYATIVNKYATFAGQQRKDHLFIADLPRNIFVQGANYTPISDPNSSFSLQYYSPIRNSLIPFNTSYVCTYANWVKVYDNFLGNFCWVPFSGHAATAMANTDALYQPWYAPAGFTRGNVNGIVDIALNPKQKQRDQLYKISVNPVSFFPNEGYVIYGQKTLLKQPSAFDRINVRRLFLNLEKATANTVKFFVFEPNTLLTRTRIVNTLTPIFENAKNTEGLYDYLIVCDERNNTPEVIDQNELVVDIYLKPVRTAEFILVNFYATRTGTNFSELVG